MNNTIVTNENYFSFENEKEFMGTTQFKRFVPELGGCECAAMARYNNTPEWQEYINLIGGESKDAFIFGSFLHAWNEGPEAMERFKQNTPELFTKKGELYAKYKPIGDIIERLEKDDMFMKALEGEKEVIFTAELFGMPWKVMLDSYNQDSGYFTDLKSSKDINGKYWSDSKNCYVNFIEAWRYDIQISIYAEIEKLSTNREYYLYPHIAVTDKKAPINDYDVIVFESENEDYETFIKRTIAEIEPYANRVRQVKYEGAAPIACGECDYCKSRKKLTSVKSWKNIKIK